MQMHRRQMLRVGVGAAVLAGAAARARADDPVADSDPLAAIRKIGGTFGTVPLETRGLADRLTLLSGPGGNMTLLGGPDGALMVDCGLPNRTDDILAAAEKAAGRVAVVVDTHWHFDHAGGNAAFARRGAKLWGTPVTRARLATDQYNEVFQMKSPASPPEALPTLTFVEAELHHNGEELHLISVPPAHTDGDLVVHFRKADVIACGDLVSFGLYPNIDASSRGWLGGMIAAADRLLKVAGPATRIVPGHGPVGTVDDLRAYRKMLVGVYDKVAPMVEAGKPVEEILRSRPTAEFDAAWGGGFFNGPVFTRIVHGGLVKHREEAKAG